MTRLKMLSLGALLGAAALSVTAATPIPAAHTSTVHASTDCPECFPIPPICEPNEPCPQGIR